MLCFFSHCNAHNNKIIAALLELLSLMGCYDCTSYMSLEMFVEVVMHSVLIILLLLVSDTEFVASFSIIRHLVLH